MSSRGQRIGRPVFELDAWRTAGFIVIVCIAVFALIFRLIQVQLVQGAAFRAAAQANQIRLIQVQAPRGFIYDRNGQVMVRSRPSFQVGLIPSLVKDINPELSTLSQTLAIPEKKLWDRLLHHHGVNYTDFPQVQTYEPYGPVVLASDIPVAKVARL